MHGIAPDVIDDDVWQGGHHQFARALFLACTSTVWETLQADGASQISRIKRAAFSGVLSKR
jgi:hypothetical protein